MPFVHDCNGDFSTVLSVLTPIEIVSIRSWDDFRYGELGPFEYELIRYTYIEYRQALIEDQIHHPKRSERRESHEGRPPD